MRTIGFTGGSSIQTLGPVSDVAAFFKLIGTLGEAPFPQLLDRLYRRYIRMEDLDAARAEMATVEAAFAGIPAVKLDLAALGVDAGNSRLDLDSATAAAVFARYFAAFADVAETAALSFEAFKDFPGYDIQPVKTVITDLDQFVIEKDRPLADYDALQGKPFWQR